MIGNLISCGIRPIQQIHFRATQHSVLEHDHRPLHLISSIRRRQVEPVQSEDVAVFSGDVIFFKAKAVGLNYATKRLDIVTLLIMYHLIIICLFGFFFFCLLYFYLVILHQQVRFLLLFILLFTGLYHFPFVFGALLPQFMFAVDRLLPQNSL